MNNLPPVDFAKHETARDLRNRDQDVIERAVPAMMLFLLLEQCKKIGLEMRADVLHHLNSASVAPLANLDMLSISRVAAQVDVVATTLLRDFGVDDPREALYVTSMFVLLLVEENRLADKGNQAVLVSLMLLDDVRDEEPDVEGYRPVWMVNERRWKEAAAKMMTRAGIMGFYANYLPPAGA